MLPIILRVASSALTRKNLVSTPIRAKKFKQQRDYKSLRREVSKLASTANKRIKRLEKAGFDNTHAYSNAFKDDSSKFGVQGRQGLKEVLREKERIEKFLNSKTSTITGVKTHLEERAKKQGKTIKKGGHVEYNNQLSNIWRAQSKLEQLRQSGDKRIVEYKSSEQMKSINSIIEDLGDGYKYDDEELEVILELYIEDEEKRVHFEEARRSLGRSNGPSRTIAGWS